MTQTASTTFQSPFVGREREIKAINEWVQSDLRAKPRAGLIIGPPGTGKSRLLEEFQRRCDARRKDDPLWLVERLTITSEQAAAQAMEHMLGLLLKEFKGFVRNGPRDTEQHRAILESIPSIGNLLASLMADQTAPGCKGS